MFGRATATQAELLLRRAGVVHHRRGRRPGKNLQARGPSPAENTVISL